MNTPDSLSVVSRIFVLVCVLTGGIGIGLWMHHSGVADEQIKNTVVTTLQQEADTAVFVTGYLDISAHISLSDTRYFPETDALPWYTIPLFRAAGTPRISLGTTRTTLRVPGRVSYGFRTGGLTADDIEITEDHDVRIRLPALEIYSAEADLGRLTFQTDVGWARWSSSGRQLEQQALSEIRSALLRQGQQHLEDSRQPLIHTTRAIESLLTPAVRAAGIDSPSFEFSTRTPSVTG